MGWTNPNVVDTTGMNNGTNGNNVHPMIRSNDNFEKAVGFFNAHLPGDNGAPVKIGFLPLKASDPTHRKLLDYIDKHGAEKVSEMIAKGMTFTYNPNVKVERGLELDRLLNSTEEEEVEDEPPF